MTPEAARSAGYGSTLPISFAGVQILSSAFCVEVCNLSRITYVTYVDMWCVHLQVLGYYDMSCRGTLRS